MKLTRQNFWYEIKAWVEYEMGVSKDLLHVLLGLGVFLLLSVLLRNRPYGMLIAWILVACLQTFNELLDARDWIRWTGSVNWMETSKDFFSTLFLPTVLLFGWRWIGPARSNE